MKMSAELFAQLQRAMQAQEKQSPTAVAHLKATVSPMRYRWDRLWALPDGPSLVMKFYKEGLNDNHIDTALRRATES